MELKREFKALKVLADSRKYKIIEYEVNGQDSLTHVLYHIEYVETNIGKSGLFKKTSKLGIMVKSTYSASQIVSQVSFDVLRLEGKLYLIPKRISISDWVPFLAGFGILGASTNYVPELIIEDEGKRGILDGTVQGNHYRYEFQAE